MITNYDVTFTTAIQSRLNNEEGFYTYTYSNGEQIAIWTDNVPLFLSEGVAMDIWCGMDLLDALTFDASLNYGPIEGAL